MHAILETLWWSFRRAMNNFALPSQRPCARRNSEVKVSSAAFLRSEWHVSHPAQSSCPLFSGLGFSLLCSLFNKGEKAHPAPGDMNPDGTEVTFFTATDYGSPIIRWGRGRTGRRRPMTPLRAI